MKAKSVNQFCENNNISRGMFYKLLRQGRGPRIMKVGNRTLVTPEAEEDWRKEMEV